MVIQSKKTLDTLVYAVDRKNPIDFKNNLDDVKKIGNEYEFRGNARPGEFYTFQIAVYTLNESSTDIDITFSDLKSEACTVMSSSIMTCFNLEGVNSNGVSFKKTVRAESGKIKPLWVGLFIPKTMAQGEYTGEVFISIGEYKKAFRLSISVSGEVLNDWDDSELYGFSRLGWLNSRIGLNGNITSPYTPLTVDGNEVNCLGRTLILDESGFPSQINTCFDKSLAVDSNTETDILARPVEFIIETGNGNTLWTQQVCSFKKIAQDIVEWEAFAENQQIAMKVKGYMEYDGLVRYDISIKALNELNIKDITLDISFNKAIAEYVMGMGKEGGALTSSFDWKWDSSVHQDSIWIGDINAGLRCQLKGNDYVRPLLNSYYRYRSMRVPDCWDNGGKGGVRLVCNEDTVSLQAYSSERALTAGTELEISFEMFITPLKPVDFNKHWNTRYYHGTNMDTALENGASVMNIHHGTDLYPFINYPFFQTAELKEFIDEMHKNNLKVKLYYTIREITDHMVELPAVRSLDNEILVHPHGQENTWGWEGMEEWISDNLGDDVTPAWKQEFLSPRFKGQIDAAMLVDGNSRFVNYYLEGLHWLLKNLEIDGIYIDVTALDHNGMRRVRKILESYSKDKLIDFHSCNYKYPHTGTANSVNIFMEALPYVDSIWFGENFDYDASPDYWLTEVSGLPFGVTGEMLEGGGNPWRGMLYGMTTRVPWAGKNPSNIWRLWDDFGIQDSRMVGYWDEMSPVRTNMNGIIGTVYLKKDKALIVLASWEKEHVMLKLEIDWIKLDISQKDARVYVPEVEGLQDYKEIDLDIAIPVSAKEGLFIIIEQE